jgi:hypothetical protein
MSPGTAFSLVPFHASQDYGGGILTRFHEDEIHVILMVITWIAGNRGPTFC